MYEFARKYFAARTRGEGEEEIRAALLTSYMYVKSGHSQEAEELMKEMYGKYPGNEEIACDYVYTLLENKKPEQALAVIKAQGARAPSLLYLQAVASSK
jgi:thioredoxin-like negative regulator of GroEL